MELFRNGSHHVVEAQDPQEDENHPDLLDGDDDVLGQEENKVGRDQTGDPHGDVPGVGGHDPDEDVGGMDDHHVIQREGPPQGLALIDGHEEEDQQQPHQ